MSWQPGACHAELLSPPREPLFSYYARSIYRGDLCHAPPRIVQTNQAAETVSQVFSAIMADASELRRRAVKATEDEQPPAQKSAAAAPQKAWYEHLSVRAILLLLSLFLLMHLFLWAVVYSFWRDQDHARLRSTVSEAWNSLGALREHLL